MKEVCFDGGPKDDVDYRMSRSKERHRMYFYEKQHLPSSPVHTTLRELMGAVDRSIALFTQQDRVRFFHLVTMRHLRFSASSFEVPLEEG